jgi:transposase
MKGKRYTDEFKKEAVKQVTDRGYSVSEVVKRLGTTTHNLYLWLKKYGDPSPRQADKADLTVENARLKADLKRKHEFAGPCVVTTMTALYLLDDERFVPFSCKDQVGIRHWWFVDIDDNETFDPTGTQYNKRELENLHRSGKPTPYYGWGQRPATRFLDLISGIQPTAVRYSTKAITN